MLSALHLRGFSPYNVACTQKCQCLSRVCTCYTYTHANLLSGRTASSLDACTLIKMFYFSATGWNNKWRTVSLPTHYTSISPYNPLFKRTINASNYFSINRKVVKTIVNGDLFYFTFADVGSNFTHRIFSNLILHDILSLIESFRISNIYYEIWKYLLQRNARSEKYRNKGRIFFARVTVYFQVLDTTCRS